MVFNFFKKKTEKEKSMLPIITYNIWLFQYLCLCKTGELFVTDFSCPIQRSLPYKFPPLYTHSHPQNKLRKKNTFQDSRNGSFGKWKLLKLPLGNANQLNTIWSSLQLLLSPLPESSNDSHDARTRPELFIRQQ